MNRYGSDKPDTRFAMELTEHSDVFRGSQFKVFRSVLDGGGVIKAINAKAAAALLSQAQPQKWAAWPQAHFAAQGLAYIKWTAGAGADRQCARCACPTVTFINHATPQAHA